MGPLNVSAASAVRTVSSERGVLLVSCGGDVSSFEVRPARAAGVQLQALGVLSSVLYAKSVAGEPNLTPNGHRALVPGSVLTVSVAPELYDAVVEVCASGRVLLAEAASSLPALRKQVELLRGVGAEVRFVRSALVLSPDQEALLDSAVEKLSLAEGEQAVRVASWALPAEDAAWVAEHGATVVYTDGSCLADTGFASWAWWAEDGRSASGTVAAVSSSYVERRAALEALRAVSGPVLLVSDFTDLVSRPSARVLSRYEACALKSLRRVVESRQVRFLTVKGHDVCPGNIAADALAGRTLSSAWAKVSGVPGLQDRLVALSEVRKATLKRERHLAAERRRVHELRYGATPAARRAAKALRKKKRAARRAQV